MMKRNLTGRTTEQLFYRYVRALSYRLTYSDRDQLFQRYKGFVDGLAWNGFITSDERMEFYNIASSCVKSMVRHYKKIGKWRE